MERNKRKLGDAYEQVAVDYLIKRQYAILTRNFYTKFGEIDIVALDGNVLCFIEVKYRKTADAGNPMEAITVTKQKRICNSARVYLMKYPKYQRLQVRFDVLGILGQEVELLQNAFPYIGAM